MHSEINKEIFMIIKIWKITKRICKKVQHLWYRFTTTDKKYKKASEAKKTLDKPNAQ